MKKRYWILFIAVLSVPVALPVLGATKVKTNHPLVTPYDGSKIYSKHVKEFDAYRVFKGRNPGTTCSPNLSRTNKSLISLLPWANKVRMSM